MWSPRCLTCFLASLVAFVSWILGWLPLPSDSVWLCFSIIFIINTSICDGKVRSPTLLCGALYSLSRNRREGEQMSCWIPYSELISDPRREHTVTSFSKCQHLIRIRKGFYLYIQSNVKLSLGKKILFFQMDWKLDRISCDCLYTTRSNIASLFYHSES